jgi:hypothetical protein
MPKSLRSSTVAEASGAIETREARREDLPAIGELYRAVKGRPRPEPVTRQRLFDTPWGDSIAMVAFDGELCVGLAVFWPVMLRVGGEPVLGAQAMEAATHPDYRRRPRMFLGLALDARELAKERRIEVLYTFPNARSIKLTKLVGATYLGEVGGWGIELGQRRPRMPRLTGRRQGRMETGAPERTELATLVEAAQPERDAVRIEKTDTWLSWRYSDEACELFTWLTVRDGAGALRAAALVGERDPASWGPDFAGILRVHELFAVEEGAATTVLRGAVDHARRSGARKLDLLVKDPALERAAAAAGLREEHRHPMTTLRLATRELEVDTHDFERWRVISGDHDFF